MAAYNPASPVRSINMPAIQAIITIAKSKIQTKYLLKLFTFANL
jgi:hypothetical protein